MNRRQFITGTALGAGALVGSTAAYGAFIETQRLTTTQALDRHALGIGLRIVQLSDFHFQHLMSVHEKIADELKRLRPDVVIISGDTIDRKYRLARLPELLRALPLPAQTFATLGNWEHQAELPLGMLRGMYAKNGIELLINHRIRVQGRTGSLDIAGLDDSTAGSPDVRTALRTDGATLCIAHSPAFRDRLMHAVRHEEQLPDIMLAGHTHGGQITIAGWAPVRPRGSGRYLYGWYRERKPHLFVSRGIGTTSIPVRLGAPPELVVFDL